VEAKSFALALAVVRQHGACSLSPHTQPPVVSRRPDADHDADLLQLRRHRTRPVPIHHPSALRGGVREVSSPQGTQRRRHSLQTSSDPANDALCGRQRSSEVVIAVCSRL
jgi:hypothetical protein